MIRADSHDVVYGIGASYHISQVYSLRLEYQRLDDIGSPTTGSEDASAYLLGLTMRF
jgi:hypothetical protein